jgi:hypothetical protein
VPNARDADLHTRTSAATMAQSAAGMSADGVPGKRMPRSAARKSPMMQMLTNKSRS